MDQGTPSMERRRRPRVELAAMATLYFTGERVGTYVVQNISARGALLTGRWGLDPGSAIALKLELPNGESLLLDGRVTRKVLAAEGLVALAIDFRHHAPDAEDAVQQAMLDVLERAAESGAKRSLLFDA